MNPDAFTASTDDLSQAIVNPEAQSSGLIWAEKANLTPALSPLEASVKDLPKRVMRWSWILLIPLVIVPVLAVNRGRNSSASADEVSQSQALPVQTQVLEPASSYSVQRTYTGEIVARRSSDLGFEQPGMVVEMLVDEGEWVKAGAPLARLDTRNLQAQRQQLEAQKRQASARFQELQQGPRQENIAAAQASVQDLKAQLDLAYSQQQRRENLYAQGAISREELDSAKFSAAALANRLQQSQSQLDELLAGTRVEQVTAQDAQVEQIEASIQNIDVSLAKSILYAPFSGRVSRRVVDEGVVVGAGQTVLRLVEGEVEARIGIPIQIANRITKGSQQTIEVSGQTFNGTVQALLPELDDTSQTVTAVITLPIDNPPTIGATARLVLQEQQPETGYWLPTSALVAGDRGLWSTYVLTSPGNQIADNIFEVSRREVEVLYTEGDRAFVRGLLQPEDVVIISGTHRIVPGQLVQN